MRQPKNRTVKTFVTSTAFASMVMAAPIVGHAELGDQPLKQGMSDPDVKQLQDVLKDKGYFHYPESTGYFGSITKNAVIDFQKDHGLKATGVVKGKMFRLLEAAEEQRTSVNQLLRIGSRGEAVRDLQSELKQLGHYRGNIDGIYGPITASAVKQFQRANRLQVDGIAGPETFGALYEQPSQSTPPKKNNKPKNEINTNKLLKIGSRGKDVSTLQQKLKALGHYTYTVDGIYGSITASAVRKYQRANGLKVDGIAGPRTLSALAGDRPKQQADNNEKNNDTAQSNDGLLRFHDRGDNVVDLQKKLKRVGTFNQSPTGYFGMHTDRAVREFQAKYGLAVDGIVGPKTRAKLSQVIASKDSGTGSGGSSISAMNLIADAADLLGVPYVWGGTSPSAGFDCSGFVQYVFKQNGLDIPRTVASMWNWSGGTKVSSNKLRPGDVVFFENTYTSGPSHNGIYIGNGQFIQSGSSTGVTVSNLNSSYWSSHYLGAKRFF